MEDFWPIVVIKSLMIHIIRSKTEDGTDNRVDGISDQVNISIVITKYWYLRNLGVPGVHKQTSDQRNENRYCGEGQVMQ